MGAEENEKDIKELYGLHMSNVNSLATVRETQVGIEKDVKHIRDRIDNGMSKTIASMNERFIELQPVIKEHQDIVSRIKDIGWWAVKGFLLSIILLIAWAIAQGWHP